MSSSDQQFVRVNLPSNAIPGSKLNISTDNGKAFEIVVPEGAHPGDTITVQIPHDLTTNDTTTYINAKGEVEHSSNRKALGAAAVATPCLDRAKFLQPSFYDYAHVANADSS